MITISSAFFTILLVLSALFVIGLYRWLFYPFNCNCGRSIRTRRAIKRHLNDKHFLK